MAAAQGTMTIEWWLARMAALEREEPQLQRGDPVLARGHAPSTLPTIPPAARRHDPGSA